MICPRPKSSFIFQLEFLIINYFYHFDFSSFKANIIILSKHRIYSSSSSSPVLSMPNSIWNLSKLLGHKLSPLNHVENGGADVSGIRHEAIDVNLFQSFSYLHFSPPVLGCFTSRPSRLMTSSKFPHLLK